MRSSLRPLCARRRQQQALFFSFSTRKIATSIFLSHLVVSVSGDRFYPSLALFCSPHHRGQVRRQQKQFITTTRLFSTSLGFTKEDDDDEQEEEDTDPLRWERMYEQGARSTNAKKRVMSSATSSSSATAPRDDESPSAAAAAASERICSEVRVVSFDLDNTLWNTGATIGAANDALAQWLDENNVVQPERTEVVMGKFFKANKGRYCPAILREDDDDKDRSSSSHKAPVLLTLLRKDVIAHILEEHNGYTTEQAKEMADEAFETWVNARHAAIDGCMAREAPETMRDLIDDLKRQSTTSYGGPVVVGAITDGNSDPRRVERLAPYFDFLIQSEQVGVSKPNPQVYLQAVRHVFKSHPHVFEDAPSVVASDSTRSTLSDEEIEKLIGPWWVHVGDDFVKDIVAAKTLNMRSIWSRELVLNKNDDKDKKSKSIVTSSVTISSSTTAVVNGSASPDDKGQKQGEEEEEPILSVIMPDEQPQPSLKDDLPPPLPPKSSSSLQPKEGRQNTIIKMQVGSKDYLANSLQQEFADAVVDRFADVRTVLRDWHFEGIQQISDSKVDTGMAVAATVSSVEAETPLVSSSQSPPNNDSASSSATPVGNAKAKTAEKFCIFCGESLPAVANFCSSCGQKQQQQ